MLKNLVVGQNIKDRFGVVSVNEKTTTKGDPYLIIELTHPSGTIQGKVWSDALPQVDLDEGSVAELEATVDQYRGVNNFNIQKARTVSDDHLDNYITEKPTLVFDIETVGREFKELDEIQQDYLINNLEKNFNGTLKQKKERTGLYPMFGFVVTIGMWNPSSKKGAVYYLSDKTQKAKQIKKSEEKSIFLYKGFKDEKSLLEGFWEAARKYERYVTYNGSGFDFPFLVFRSGIHRVRVPFEIKNSGDKFIDLAHKIRVNNRSIKLEQVCKAFGISNPKQKGVSGMEVANLYRKGKLMDILEYVGRDVVATAELYKIWKTYLAGRIVV